MEATKQFIYVLYRLTATKFIEILLPFVVAATSRLRNRRWNPPELVSNRTLLIVPTHDLILHGIVVSSAGFSGFRKGYYGFAIPIRRR